MTNRLIDHAHGGLVVFCGAGTSMVAPSFLPSWWQLNEQVIEALARQIEPYCGVSQTTEWARLINDRRSSGSFPPEYQAEVVVKHFGASYFEVLKCLDGDEPNDVHLALAELARSGRVRAIVTSNFDRLLELAFRRAGVPLQVSFSGEHFEALADRLAGTPADGSPCQLLKLHGSVDDAGTLVDTLAQRMRCLPPAICVALKHYLTRHHWLFMGYSGADLDANPQYLCLEAAAQPAIGFHWLVRNADDKLPAGLLRVRSLYGGERAQFVEGELPQWLQETFGTMLPSATLRAPTLKPEDSDRRRSLAQQAIVRHARDWAETLGGVRAALVIADMLEHVAGSPQPARSLLQRVLEHPSTSREAMVAVANGLANTLNSLGDPNGAHEVAEDALARASDADPADRIGLENTLGLIEYRQGKLPSALARFERVYEASLKTGDDDRRGIALHNRAMALKELGRHAEARQCYEEELDLVRRSGDAMAQAQTLNNLSDLFQQTDQFPEAIAAANAAISLRERLGDDRGVADSMGNIASTLSRQGELGGAVAIFETILGIFRRVGHKPGEIRTILNLGSTAKDAHDLATAEERFRAGLELATEAGLESERTRAMREVAAICRETGRHAEAQGLLDEALERSRCANDRSGEAAVLNHLGILQWRTKCLPEAEESLRRAIEIHESLHERLDAEAARSNLAAVLQLRGKPEEAVALLKNALDVAERLGAKGDVAHKQYNLGALMHQQGREEEALVHLAEAQRLYRAIGQLRPAVRILATLGEATGVNGKISVSLRWFDQAIELAADDAQRVAIAKPLTNVMTVLLEHGHRQYAEMYAERLRAMGLKVDIREQ